MGKKAYNIVVYKCLRRARKQSLSLTDGEDQGEREREKYVDYIAKFDAFVFVCVCVMVTAFELHTIHKWGSCPELSLSV